MSNSEKPILFAMSAAPFWHCGRTIQKNSIHICIALIPAIIMAIYHGGMPAIGVMALSVLTAMLTEEFWTRIMGRDSTIDDGTAAVSGLLLAFLLPAIAPFWLVILASFCAITLGKMAFGGFGTNPVNTVLVGWVLVFVSFPVLLDPNSVLLYTEFSDPLVRLKFFGVYAIESFSFGDLALGQQIGTLGASQIIGVLIGGLYLATKGIIRWEISISFLASVILFGGILNIINPDVYVNPFYHLVTGSTLFCAFFLVTEYSCAPARPIGMLLYGLLGGCLVVLIRTYGMYTDGAPFAILVINLLTPYFDMIKPKPFGVRS